MADWYRHDIPSWMDGTETLSDNAYRAYHVILQLIYLHEGPITLNERGIAGRCNQSVRTFKKSLQELIGFRKLTLQNGKLDNERSETELQILKTNRENAGKGGRSPRKSRINKTPTEATLQSSASLLDETKRDETRVDNLLSSGDDVTDPKKANGKESDLAKAFDNWNTIAAELGLPVCRKLSPDRARKLKVRLHEHGLKGWNEALRNLYSLPFCLGENKNGWKADFDFLLQPKSFNKVLEMAYAQAEGDKH